MFRPEKLEAQMMDSRPDPGGTYVVQQLQNMEGEFIVAVKYATASKLLYAVNFFHDDRAWHDYYASLTEADIEDLMEYGHRFIPSRQYTRR
jgi:hypothetical protein